MLGAANSPPNLKRPPRSSTNAIAHAFVVPSFTKSSRLYRQTSILASSSSSSSRDSHGENNDENDEKVLRVPSNLFPGFPSPEKKAASSLVTLMTMAACRVVLDQWCGTRHRSPMYNKLIDYMQKGAPHTQDSPDQYETATHGCTSSCDTRSSISASPRYEFSKRGNCSSIRSLTGTR